MYGKEQHLLNFYYNVDETVNTKKDLISEGSVCMYKLKPLMSVDGFVCDVETDENDRIRFSKLSKFEPVFKETVLHIKKIIMEGRKTDLLCDFD